MINQRSYWKTGPVHLMWDDQRQVWCGGNQMVCGTLSGKIEAPSDPNNPTSFVVNLLRRDSRQAGSKPGVSVKLIPLPYPETIEVVNRDPTLDYSGDESGKVFCICVRINYEWLPIWVSCP